MNNSIEEIMDALVNSESVTGAILVGKEGFIIHNAIKSVRRDVEEIGAILAGCTGPAEVVGTRLDKGELRQAMFEYSKGIIIIVNFGEAILGVVASQEANLGLLRIETKKSIKGLIKVLTEM